MALVAAVLFAVVAAMAALSTTGTGDQPVASAPAATGTPGADGEPPSRDATRARLVEDDPLAVGPVDAPVVIVTYSDFSCTYCARFAQSTEPTLVDRYVESGRVRIEWRDYPYLREESTAASLAARAAAAQGRFWEYQRALFAEHQSSDGADFTPETLLGLATQLGLDTQSFADAITDPATLAAVQADRDEGLDVGVTGTPTFLINGVPMVGAQPVDAFVAAIDAALAVADRSAPSTP